MNQVFITLKTMDSIITLLPELHFYIMWFSLLSSATCIISESTRSLLKPNWIKILIFVLLIFASFSWVNDVTTMRNTPDFSNTTNELDLYKLKHEYSKLQRDVYMKGLEFYSLALLLVIPRFHDYYVQIIKAHERKLKQEIKAHS